MEINLETVNPTARLIAPPTTSSLPSLRRAASRPQSPLKPTSSLFCARAEVVRGGAWENLAWLTLALSAGLLIITALSTG